MFDLNLDLVCFDLICPYDLQRYVSDQNLIRLNVRIQ